ncbi:MBL fold metallo-hydrolase [Luteimicrobium subarcticum]|uniref:L-ascorbate metabolism protein UlaG (Beta-lactamase superfamily) n=1 Tax=Luteimicrobium subarcticum TaxID=620910 RepID=A0A2M8W3S5_9MICO|nr:MBL fold metallo-hydrolase [Luteimicrobium subarcticum]PJI85578.1 L-ascorbate metabolism protein UlaG (beta-lactamase superfamily) [Luteimicrobium subarcticum]
MRLEHLGHSSIRLSGDPSDGSGVLVVDPGVFSVPSADAVVDGADAILVTHEHVDHLDVPRVAPVVTDRRLPVWAPQGVLDVLADAGVPADLLHVAAPGTTTTVAGHEVLVVGTGRHEAIHADVPVPSNAAFLLDGAVLVTGDEYADLPAGFDLDVLLLPVAAPWLRFGDAVDYARGLAPRRVLPVHDVFLSDVGRGFVLRTLGPDALGAGHRYELVDAAGEPLDVRPRPDLHADAVAASVLHDHPEYAEPVLLEDDETVPPRPEEAVADAERV